MAKDDKERATPEKLTEVARIVDRTSKGADDHEEEGLNRTDPCYGGWARIFED